MKKIFLFMIAGVFSMAAFAQSEQTLKISAGAELSIPTGTFGDSYTLGVGASGQVEVKLQDKLYGTGYVGVLAYRGKKVDLGGVTYRYPDQTIVPIKVGAKYYLVGSFYGAAQIGVGLFNGNGSSAAFAYTPMVGYNLKTKSDNSFDISLKYDGYSRSGGSLGAVGVRVAYVF